MNSLMHIAVCAAAALAPTWGLAQDAHLARNLAATCANCHGTDGKAQGAMPALAGYQADRLIATMADFKSGKRPATIMHQISKGYTDAQVALIAGYFAQQKP
jgi:cytochrome subunit of sulfide dehydrogenase